MSVPPRTTERYWSPRDVAERLGYSRRWVLARVAAGDLAPTLRIGDDIRIPESALARYVDEHTVRGLQAGGRR